MSDQASLARRLVIHLAGDYPCHRLVTVAHQQFFSLPHMLDVSAEPSFQVAYIHGSHNRIIADMTILVTLCGARRDGLVPVAFQSLTCSRVWQIQMFLPFARVGAQRSRTGL